MNEGPVCKTCVAFKRFKESCWYYWDHKKACTQYRASDFSEPTFKAVDEWNIQHVLKRMDTRP